LLLISLLRILGSYREQGVNYQAQPLEVHEINQLKSDPEAMERLIESFVPPLSFRLSLSDALIYRYRIMLAFYGLRLVNSQTGELSLEDSTPAPSPSSYLRRFQNLERNSHNFLRITRILKCMNEVRLSLSSQQSPVLRLFCRSDSLDSLNIPLHSSSTSYPSNPVTNT